MTDTTLSMPMLHMNGSDPDRLLEDYRAAMTAVHDALDAVRRTGPNGRDYYPMGLSALAAAQREHGERVASLQAVFNELCEITIHVSKSKRT